MERKDKWLAGIIGFATVFCGLALDINYSDIADSGLTLSSIVLAVYVAAIVGLINSDLAKSMQRTTHQKKPDKTQLGVLVRYFEIAIFFSIGTIAISSTMLLIPELPSDAEMIFVRAVSLLSVCGLTFYVENIVFLGIIIRFMLNRQIWNR